MRRSQVHRHFRLRLQELLPGTTRYYHGQRFGVLVVSSPQPGSGEEGRASTGALVPAAHGGSEELPPPTKSLWHTVVVFPIDRDKMFILGRPQTQKCSSPLEGQKDLAPSQWWGKATG